MTKQGTEMIPNRARFQSTYMADPNALSLQQAKNKNLSSELLRNLFKGKIEKKNLNSTFAIPYSHRSIALPNREIYVVGGQYDGETVPFVFKYNWDLNSLQEAGKPLQVSRSNFGIVQLNNYIYVVGGYNEKLGTLKSCEIMDVITKQWSSIADLNVGCRDLSVCSFNNRIIFKFGGINSDDQLNEYIEKYEPNTNRWISFHIQNRTNLKSKFQLYALSGAVQINHNHIMVFGGSDAGLSEDTDQTFLCQVGIDFCKIVGLNKVTISTKGAVITNPVVQNNRIYSMQVQRDKKGGFHPYKRNMMLYEDKQWKVNY